MCIVSKVLVANFNPFPLVFAFMSFSSTVVSLDSLDVCTDESVSTCCKSVGSADFDVFKVAPEFLPALHHNLSPVDCPSRVSESCTCRGLALHAAKDTDGTVDVHA